MRISVILELEEVGAGAAAGVAGGWFNIVITTGDGVLLWQKRMRGKARPFVKDVGVLLLYSNRPIFVTVRGRGLIFSVVHLPPITIDSPFTFTILIIFFTDTFAT